MIDPRTFLSYLYYQAAYTHTFVIYAFCNVDDVTWGTKGVHNDKNKNSKESKYYENKVAFMGKWIAANGVISFLLIVINDIFVEEQNKAIILTAIGMYSTIIVAFKCLFGVLYHFRCIFLDIFCMRDIRYNANDK